MRTPGARYPSRAALVGLSLLFAALLGAGGCSLLVGAELSEKPEETTGAGGAGQGGAGATSTSAQVTSGPSVASSTSTAGSSGTAGSASASTGSGGIKCSNDLADCDGKAGNGCETNIKTDPKNCGACKHECSKSEKCDESECG